MSLFIVDITKQHSVSLQTWGNRYLVDTTDLTAASSAAPIIGAYEQTVHSEGVLILQARIATLEANDGLYVNVPMDLVGLLDAEDKLLPLITTINLEMVPNGFGRPSRKYYHPCVGMTYVSATLFQQWDTTFLAGIRDGFVTLIEDLIANDTPLNDPDGQRLTNLVVAQRQYGSHHFHKRSPRTPA
jgi:hypothetical protein